MYFSQLNLFPWKSFSPEQLHYVQKADIQEEDKCENFDGHFVQGSKSVEAAPRVARRIKLGHSRANEHSPVPDTWGTD